MSSAYTESLNSLISKIRNQRLFSLGLILVFCVFPSISLCQNTNTYIEYGNGWLTGKPAFSPDDKYLVLQTSKGIQFYELPSADSLISKAFLLEHREYRSGDGFCFTNDKKRLVSASESEKSIKVWDWRSQKLLKVIPAQLYGGVADLAISNDDSKLVIGSVDKMILVDLKNDVSAESISTKQYKVFPQPAYCFNLRFVDDNTVEFGYVDKQYQYKIEQKEFITIEDRQHSILGDEKPMEVHSNTNKWICKVNSFYHPLRIQLVEDTGYCRCLTELKIFPRFYMGFSYHATQHIISPNGKYYSMIQRTKINGKDFWYCIIWELEKDEVLSELFIPEDRYAGVCRGPDYYFKENKLFVHFNAVVDIKNSDFTNFRKYLRRSNLSLAKDLYLDQRDEKDFRILETPPHDGPYRYYIHPLRESIILSSSADKRHLLLRDIKHGNIHFIIDTLENKIVKTFHMNKDVSNVSKNNTFIVYEDRIDGLNIPVLEFPTCKEITRLTGIKNKISRIYTTPNGDYYITSYYHYDPVKCVRELNIIDANNNRLLKNVLPRYEYNKFSFSEDGQILILFSTNHKVILFDLQNLKTVKTLDISEDLHFKSATIPKDSDCLYVVFGQGFVRKYKLQ